MESEAPPTPNTNPSSGKSARVKLSPIHWGLKTKKKKLAQPQDSPSKSICTKSGVDAVGKGLIGAQAPQTPANDKESARCPAATPPGSDFFEDRTHTPVPSAFRAFADARREELEFAPRKAMPSCSRLKKLSSPASFEAENPSSGVVRSLTFDDEEGSEIGHGVDEFSHGRVVEHAVADEGFTQSTADDVSPPRNVAADLSPSSPVTPKAIVTCGTLDVCPDAPLKVPSKRRIPDSAMDSVRRKLDF